ncbi:hypothetical protein D3C75_1130880 [compost metagenome]
MPLFYALSKKGAGIINVVFLVALVILAQPFALLMNLASEEGMVTGQVIGIVTIGILLLFFGSYLLTVRLFAKKDL